MVDVLGYLASKDLHLRQADARNIHTHCVFCNEDPAARGRLYVNVDPDAEIPGLYQCLAGETEVITWDGVRPIKELAGGVHKIMTDRGQWVDAPIRSFGQQELMRLILSRNGVRKEIFATPEHRWLVRQSRESVKRREIATKDLRRGHRLAYTFGQGVKAVRPSAFGIAQGFTFGDGTLVNGGAGAAVALHKPEMLRFFPLSPTGEYRSDTGKLYTRATDLPAFFKRYPDLNDSRSFLYGWLAGYFAADGHVSRLDSAVTLWSASLDNLRFVENLCHRIGVGVFEPRGPYYGKGRFNDEPMYSLSFLRSTLTEEFFVREVHRAAVTVPKYERKGWQVVDVERTDRMEEVYCAIVEGTESFALAGNILTGNCKICDAKGSLVSLKRHFGDRIDNVELDSETRAAIFGAAAVFYADQLFDFYTVWGYLTGPRRGLTQETLLHHQLGYAPMEFDHDVINGTTTVRRPRSLYRHLREHGHDAKEILASGLCVSRNDKIVDAMGGMITIPYHVAGQVVAMRGRAWPFDAADWENWDGARYDPPKSKYLSTSGSRTRLFNVDVMWGADDVILAEGEMDALVLTQNGFPAVGVPGANTWQASWDDYLATLKRVWLVFDRDAAGERAANKLVEQWGTKIRRVHLSEEGIKCDPTQWFVEQGHTATEFEALLAAERRGILVTVDEAIEEFKHIQGTPGIKFNWTLLDILIAPGLQPSQVMVLLAKTGCLTGDTEIAFNRCGKGFRMPIATAYKRWTEGRYKWNRKHPTFVQRADDGVVRLGEVDEIWYSGVKRVFEVTTASGRSIKATAEHPFLTPNGWKKLQELHVGDEVCVNAGRSAKGRGRKQVYRIRSGLLHHPYRMKRELSRTSTNQNCVALHRLVAEAQLNGLDLESFLECCRTGDVAGLQFIDPALYAVHHIDHDSRNNDPSNLKVLTHAEHHSLHAAEGGHQSHVLEQVGVERVVSVVDVGEQETYDISMKDEPHNFMANGFAVHNTGKTILLLNMMHRMRMVPGQENMKILFVSLEQTRGEWWDRARRIHRFYNIESTEIEAAEFWRDNLLLIDRNRVTEADLRQAIDDFVYEMAAMPDLVVVDYVGYYARSYKGEAYERTSQAMMALKAVAKDYRVPIIAPQQVSRIGIDGQEFATDAARDSGVVEETSDFLFTMWTPDNVTGRAEEERFGEYHLRVGKSRHGGRGCLLGLQFAPISLVLIPDDRHVQTDPLAAAARREFEWKQRFRDDWPRAVFRHRTGFMGHLTIGDDGSVIPQFPDVEERYP